MNGRLTLALALPILLFAPAPAHAATVSCKAGHYSPGLDVSKLRAIGLPARTDGYAPRCLVAEFVATDVLRAREQRKKTPRSVHTFGARWDGGTWKVKRSGRHFTATKGSQKVTFDA